MSDLAGRIGAAIRRDGPMTVERFWTMALFDRDSGYYATRAPFGIEGDFVTAPEISQMFGELIGVWCVAAWRELQRPSPVLLAEIGPGRGTLMADILRTVRRLDLDFARAAKVRLVETSDRLAAEQIARLAAFDLPIVRRRRLGELEDAPLLVVANELFDALPIRQFVRAADGWRERLVGIEGPGLAFVEGAPLPVGRPPLPGLPVAATGEILEVSPAREALAAEVGARVARFGGAALAIDYGHPETGFGDTLQALRGHAFAQILDDPGRQDITSHVDFGRLAGAFAASGATVSPVGTQGDFLLSLGLLERAGILGRDLDAQGRADLEAAARRLAGSGEGEMGRLFKVLAAASRPLSLPPFEPSFARA